MLWLGPVVALLLALGPDHVFTKIGMFFSKMAVVTFGGAYAVLAYVAQEAVETYGWLRPGEMLDGLGLAETTPGPLIMVVQFVGFLAAFRDPGTLDPLRRRRPRRAAHHLGDLRAVLSLDLPRRPLYRGAARQPRARGGALRRSPLPSSASSSTSPSGSAFTHCSAKCRGSNCFGRSLDVPVLTTINPAALILTLAAILAVFRFKFGVIPVLAACSAAGVLYFLALEAIA